MAAERPAQTSTVRQCWCCRPRPNRLHPRASPRPRRVESSSLVVSRVHQDQRRAVDPSLRRVTKCTRHSPAVNCARVWLLPCTSGEQARGAWQVWSWRWDVGAEVRAAALSRCPGLDVTLAFDDQVGGLTWPVEGCVRPCVADTQHVLMQG